MGSRQFEDAMKRLEAIVDFLEGEEISLDDALKRYEEGIKLARFCSKKLQEAEKKIEVLSRDESGKIVKKSLSVSEKESNSSMEEDNDEEELLF
jgi:exodeoxyribonuclease VII small subunit